MTRELNYDHKDINPVIQELNRELGNQPFKVIEEETGYKILVPEEGDDPLDLFNEEIDALDDMVEPYLKALNMEAELGFDILGQTIWVNIDGPEAGIFLKNRGELLNDLQYTLEVFLNKTFPQVRAYVKCDAEARRRNHIDNMLSLAQKKAQYALESGEDQKLPPMNAYERRVIHLAFLPDDKVSTKSHGVGALKQIIICPVQKRPASNQDPQGEPVVST